MDPKQKSLAIGIAAAVIIIVAVLWYSSAEAQQVQGQIATSNSQSGSQASSNSAAIGGQGGSAGAIAGGGSGGRSSANNNGNNQQIILASEAVDLGDAVPAAIAPALTSTLSGVCFGSASGGLGASGIGLSFGKTVEDLRCQRRLDANSLTAIGLPALAVEVMCATPEVLAADAKMATPVCADNVIAAADDADKKQKATSSMNYWDSIPTAYVDTREIWSIDQANVDEYGALKLRNK